MCFNSISHDTQDNIETFTLEGFNSLQEDSLRVIEILAPILLIISVSIIIFKLVISDMKDESKTKKKIFNAFIAYANIFFISTVIDSMLNVVGNSCCYHVGFYIGDGHYIDSFDTSRVGVVERSSISGIEVHYLRYMGNS